MPRDGSLTPRDLVEELGDCCASSVTSAVAWAATARRKSSILSWAFSCGIKPLLRRRAMRQLLGKTSYRGVTEEVYLSETVRCEDCRITVPMGIEVDNREE